MVDDATCRSCPMRAQLITQAEEAILDRNALAEEVTSLTRRLASLKAELTRQRTEHPLADAVTAWLDYWQARTTNGKGRAPDVSPGGSRWSRALKAIQRKVEHGQRLGETDPVEWALTELKLAVDGILLSPWHMGDNPSRKRYLKVENVLKDDEITDAFIEAGRAAADGPAPSLFRRFTPWLSPRSVHLVQKHPWMVDVLGEALDTAVAWNDELASELRRYRERFEPFDGAPAAEPLRLVLGDAA